MLANQLILLMMNPYSVRKTKLDFDFVNLYLRRVFVAGRYLEVTTRTKNFNMYSFLRKIMLFNEGCKMAEKLLQVFVMVIAVESKVE